MIRSAKLSKEKIELFTHSCLLLSSNSRQKAHPGVADNKNEKVSRKSRTLSLLPTGVEEKGFDGAPFSARHRTVDYLHQTPIESHR